MYNGPKTSQESLELTASQAYAAAAGSPNRNYATQVATNGAEIYGDLRVIEAVDLIMKQLYMVGDGFRASDYAAVLTGAIANLKEKYGV